MGKLHRRKSPDSEQLLTPRKNGLFGKRNIGVRSEDTPDKPQKSMSARRLMNSVFHSVPGGSRQKLQDESSPFDDPPAMQLELFGDHKPHYKSHGTPKTAPPSPDLVVLTTTTSKRNSPNDGAVASKDDGDETVMSDLTGTVYPTTTTGANSSPLRDGVTTDTTSKQQPLQQQQQPLPQRNIHQGVTFANTVQAAPTHDSYFSNYSPTALMGREHNDNTMMHQTAEIDANTNRNNESFECRPTVLDQVLGAVDGACNRTMDMTLSGLQVRIGGANGSTTGNPRHHQWGVAPSVDDESTFQDSTHDTMTRDTGTYASSYLCTTRDTTRDTATYTRTTADQSIEPVVKEEEEANTEIKSALEPKTRLLREPSGVHENFELVLGDHTIGEFTSEKDESKIRSWASRILSKDRGEEEKKEENNVIESENASPQKVVSDGKPPLSPNKKSQASPGKPPAASPYSKQQQREAMYKSVFGDPPLPAPGDVGVEIQSRRAQQATFSIDTPPSPKKKLSSFVNKIKKGVRRTKSATSRLAKSAGRLQHPEETEIKKSKSLQTCEVEEEKKEIEPVDVIPRETASKVAENNTAAPRTVKHPDITGLSSKPITLLGKRSNSFKPERPKDSYAEETKLKVPIRFGRLRSAPEKLASFAIVEPTNAGTEQNPAAAPTLVGQKQESATTHKPPKLHWKAATDDQGRTYYYHRASRKTQWTKPPEFDAEMAAVKKYKEEQEAIKRQEAETQQVIDGCRNVEAIQASLRKKTQRDFDPTVWQIKQEILDIVKTMPLPKGTNIDKLLIQYDGREQQLLDNLRELVESKPFDEPFQVAKKEDPPPGEEIQETPEQLNTSHQYSAVSSTAHLHTNIDVQKRVRTALSSATRLSEKTSLTEKTEKVKNTSGGKNCAGIDTIREFDGGLSTGSLSSGSQSMPPRHHEAHSFPNSARVPSKIPAVHRSRDLKVEVFANDRIAKETFNDKGALPVSDEPVQKDTIDGAYHAHNYNTKNVAQQVVAMSSVDEDDDSYNGDYEDDRGNETASENKADSISALSDADADYQTQKDNFERARRHALDVAVEREDWDLAAALSEGMKQVRQGLYTSKPEQREWTQTELDRFISENDWDAVSKYIAQMRDNSCSATSKNTSLPNSSIPRGRDPGIGRDPEGSISGYSNAMLSATSKNEHPPPVAESSKSMVQRKRSAEQPQKTSGSSIASSDIAAGKPAQSRFGARSQLQHNELNSVLNSVSSDGNSSSSYDDSDFTDGSFESEDEQGYISLRVRRSEFQC